MAAAPAVALDRLSRRFGAIEAVSDLSLEISAGETFGLLGPNGAGKTTTLAMLATLLPPTSGDASIFGRSLGREAAALRHSIGLAPQDLSLYPDLTGEENLRFFGRLYGLDAAALRARVDRLLDFVGLSERRGDRVSTYSGGMKRRLNLACGLVHDPKLLLLDEPTVGVDPQSRESLLSTIGDITDAGTTVIYTTHYMEEAERVCDRIAILDEGRAVAVGTLPELLGIVGVGEVIEIRGPGSLEAHLEGLPDVLETERENGLLRLFVASAARSLGPIAAALAAADETVEGIQVYPLNLERVFMHLTGKALRD